MAEHRVVELTTAEILPLRRLVLRNGTPSADPGYPEDDQPETMHLGVRDAGGTVIATSTWLPRACPDGDERPAIQLRGMAVAPEVQRAGLGRELVGAGCERAVASGATVVWARARDAALGFYCGAGFAVVGAGFHDAATALPHHLVVRDLTPPSG
jgi:predicted N-acetyltransferase YhbS